MPVSTRVRWLLPSRRRPRGESLFGAALRTPGAWRFFAAALPGRVGIAMTSLGLVWLVHQATGSFARAGVVVGGFAVAEATVGPVAARAIDRFGQPRVLPVSAGAHATAATGLILASRMHLPLPLVLAAAVLAGATIPQLGALTAVRWAGLLPEGPVLGAAFAMESTSNGLAYLVGPAVVATLAGTVGPTVAAAAAAGLVAGSALTLAALRATAPAPAGTRRRRPGGPRRGPGLLSRAFLVLVAVNLGIGLFFGSMQVGVTAVAVTHHLGGSAGLLYAVMSTAGLAGGLLYGRRRWTLDAAAQLRRGLWLLAAAAVPLAVAASPVALGVAQLAPGLVLSPVLIVSASLTRRAVHSEVRTQAFTWTNSASAAGIAGAAALTGYLTDTVGSRAVFAVAVTALGLTALTATSARGPVDRGRIDVTQP